MPERKLKLVPGAVPPRASRVSGEYVEIVREFLRAENDSARVDGKAKPATIVAGLKKAVRETSAAVKVVTRRDEVYLVKK